MLTKRQQKSWKYAAQLPGYQRVLVPVIDGGSEAKLLASIHGITVDEYPEYWTKWRVLRT